MKGSCEFCGDLLQLVASCCHVVLAQIQLQGVSGHFHEAKASLLSRLLPGEASRVVNVPARRACYNVLVRVVLGDTSM